MMLWSGRMGWGFFSFPVTGWTKLNPAKTQPQRSLCSPKSIPQNHETTLVFMQEVQS
ncbi:hypothetical protein DNTS_022724 [Danionella cerebrum]|uniref:Uncharacterized protein n=1 Tax=Danionella cerebrum TaxID=2873325 RepID=A0A553MY17_9TELE|nr:hypothetical protein DNTS_022724 [Danionella translucida]